MDSGDLNFDNSLTAADWLVFIANSETNLSGLSRAEAYQRGDLNGDGFNNIADFAAFSTAYDAANGGGAFAEMLAERAGAKQHASVSRRACWRWQLADGAARPKIISLSTASKNHSYPSA